MTFFERFKSNKTTHEQRLIQDAGLERPGLETIRTVGSKAVSAAQEVAIDTTDNSEEDDSEFEAEVAERVNEIETMSIDELLKDGVDDIARAELDDSGDEQYFVMRAVAVNNRAIALLLQQLIERNNK